MLSAKYALIIIPAAALLNACSPARSMLNSGKVLPKKQIRFGINYTFNVSTSPIQQTYKSAASIYQNLSASDTVDFSRSDVASTVQDVNAALMAYCVDPITMTDDIYLRVGLGHRLDVGYKNSGGANAIDVQYQFLGSNENFNNSTYRGYYGSVALQYTHKSFNFSKNPILKKLENTFLMDLNRQEITVPLIFSKAWGPEERVGCITWGLLYSHTFVSYKISTKNIYQINDQIDPQYQAPKELLSPVSANVHYGSYGAFFNLKIGKKVVYFNLGLAVYYQNYGKYELLGGKTVELKGWSFVPTYGLQFNILPKQKKAPTS